MFGLGRVLSFMPINSSPAHLLIGPILKPKLGLKRAGPAQPMSTPNFHPLQWKPKSYFLSKIILFLLPSEM